MISVDKSVLWISCMVGRSEKQSKLKSKIRCACCASASKRGKGKHIISNTQENISRNVDTQI